LRVHDRSLLECQSEVFHNTTCHINAFTIIIIITKDCYNHHVVNSFIKIINVSKRTSKFKQMITQERMKFAWEWTCVDETHQNQKINNIAVVIFKNLNHHVRKWFLTKTSFESSSNQMSHWINTLQLNWNKHLTSTSLLWSRQKQYRRQLKKCIFDKIKQLNVIHKRFVKFNINKKIELSDYIDRLFTMLNILWLRRTTKHFRFFDQSLIDVLFNIHQEIYCTLFEKFINVVND
jgi:hypothetical protein